MSQRLGPGARAPFFARFRSLRWRLTFVYLGLLSVLLLLLGVGQYFAAREVLYRSNADVLTNDYKAVQQAFIRQRAAAKTPLRAQALLDAFAKELASRQISATVFDMSGSVVAFAPATLTPNQPVVSLNKNVYVDAVRQVKLRTYYLATTGDPPQTNLAVLNIIRLGTRPLGVAQLSVPTADIDRTLAFDRLIALGGSLLVLLLAALLSPLIVGRALRPLEQMSATAGKLAAGDYKQRVAEPKDSDEIGKLALAFNQMAAGIDQAFEVRWQAEEEMRHFVADASHELRTPLTSIVGYLDVLARRDMVDAETLQTSLAAMQQESDRMTRLVNDLLTLTRFESGKAPSRQRVPLDRFLNETLDQLSLPEKGAAESRDLEPGVAVSADPEALKQVVTNLAQNALKYAPGAEQRWSVFQEGGRAAIRVRDTGPGIAAGDLPHIFDRFYRGEKARDRSTGGSGLGLAIAKSIVEAHQGTIEASSQPGDGTTFTAWLPLAA
jgi:two-component system, OmpR family, sensor kinase